MVETCGFWIDAVETRHCWAAANVKRAKGSNAKGAAGHGHVVRGRGEQRKKYVTGNVHWQLYGGHSQCIHK